jgi:hypothetical protein
MVWWHGSGSSRFMQSMKLSGEPAPSHPGMAARRNGQSEHGCLVGGL